MDCLLYTRMSPLISQIAALNPRKPLTPGRGHGHDGTPGNTRRYLKTDSAPQIRLGGCHDVTFGDNPSHLGDKPLEPVLWTHSFLSMNPTGKASVHLWSFKRKHKYITVGFLSRTQVPYGRYPYRLSPPRLGPVFPPSGPSIVEHKSSRYGTLRCECVVTYLYTAPSEAPWEPRLPCVGRPQEDYPDISVTRNKYTAGVTRIPPLARRLHFGQEPLTQVSVRALPIPREKPQAFS